MREFLGTVEFSRGHASLCPPYEHLFIASQRVRPEVAGPMINSAKQSSAGAPAGLLRRFAPRNDVIFESQPAVTSRARLSPCDRPGAGRAASETACPFRDRNVVDAGLAAAHQAFLVEFPVFVAVAAKPVAAIVMPFVGEAHGNAILA